MMVRVGVFVLLAFSCISPSADGFPLNDEAGGGATAGTDCGISALYTLSRLCGRPIEWAAIRSRLPVDRSGNFSMKELSDAASLSGFRLRGVLLDRKVEGAIDRPMLAYLHRGEHGHFLVVRPIGHTGKLVQLIDSVNPPEVMDRSALLAAPSWSGLALMPEESRWGLLALRVATGSTLIAVVAWSIARRHRARKAPRRTPGLDRVASLS